MKATRRRRSAPSLFKTRRIPPPRNIEEALERAWPRPAPGVTNAQTYLPWWFDRQRQRCRLVIEKFPSTADSKIAAQLLSDIDWTQKLVDSIDLQSDRYTVVLEAMRFAQRARDLDHNLAFAPAVDSQRRVLAVQKKATRASLASPKRARKLESLTSERYQEARKQAQTITGRIV